MLHGEEAGAPRHLKERVAGIGKCLGLRLEFYFHIYIKYTCDEMLVVSCSFVSDSL